MDQIKFELDVSKTTGQLQALERRVKKRIVRRATTAATKAVHKEARRIAPRANGFFRMSLRTVVRMQKDGSVLGRIGQQKNKQFKRKRYKGSNLNRQGYAARIWWIERGAKRHAITPNSGKYLVWTTGQRKGTKGQARFALKVDHPGMKGKRVLETAGRTSRTTAAAAFADVVTKDLAAIPNPGDQT